MSYGDRRSVAEAAAGVGATYFYRMNSVYDPDSTGVGASAIPYATWSAVYLNYRVLKTTVRLSASWQGGSVGTFANIIIAPLAFQAVLPTNTITWKMLPYAQYTPISLGTGGPCVAQLEATYLPWDVARITKPQYMDEADWTGQVGGNPARQNFIGVMFQPVGSGTVATMYFDINITYEVEWFNPIPMQ